MTELERQRRRAQKATAKASPNGHSARHMDGGGRIQANDKPPGPRAILRTASTLRSLKVEWLWAARIPRGALTLLDGDPGLGKSTITTDIAARVSRGWAMPPDAGEPVSEPADVILLSAEDDPERTIRPRLEAAGADLARVHLLDAIHAANEDRPPTLPLDLDLIEGAVVENKAGLIVIDPVMAYLGGEVDAHKDTDVRRVLHAMKRLAERTMVAVLIVRHLNKLIGGPAVYRGGGSIGIIGATRSAMVVGRDPTDPHRCVLAPVKCNLCRMPQALAYSHEPVGDVSRIGWAGECDLTADDILAHVGPHRQSDAERCADAMKDLLTGKSVETDELTRTLTEAGYSEATIKRARKRLGVRVSRVGYGAEGRWMASLPPPAGDGIPD